MITGILVAGLLSVALPTVQAVDEPVAVACKFRGQPVMLMIFRGGMGAEDNTLHIGQTPPVQLHVGSQMMMAEHRGRELIFSLQGTPTVNIDGTDYEGECVSSLQP